MTEYIEKNAAIAKLTRLEVTKPLSTMIDAKRMLADMPAADVAPVRRGHWLDLCGDYQTAKCSFCASQYEVTFGEESNGMLFDGFKRFYKYCPNCGAKMEVEHDD